VETCPLAFSVSPWPFFFFQAEDGIRAFHVTGVQTCALPIFLPFDQLVIATGARHAYFGHDEWEPFAPGLKTLEDATTLRRRILRSEERRVGKEGRARGAAG